MGAFTPIDEVWYPDEDDTAEQNVNMSTMASSIEDGIGARLRHQEIAVGCKLGMGALTLDEAWKLMPMSVTGDAGTFNNGMTVSPTGTITVNTAGMYLVSGGLGIMNVSNHSIKFEIRKNGASILFDEAASSPLYFQLAKGTTALNCVPGDTITLFGADAGADIYPPKTTTVNNATFNHLTVVLVQALPL